MVEIINVSSRGQIVIPEKVRENLGIKSGSKLVLIEKEGTILLKKEEEIRELLENNSKEEIGWMILAEQSLKELWDNPKEDKIWKRYL